jgi:choline-sulfatase
MIVGVAAPHAAERPNILLITADTFRADHIGYDGYPHVTSPNLDTLSAAGVFFKKAFTTSGWTTPGLVSIHTSLYTPAHGVDIRGKSMDPSVVTLAEALHDVGYRVPNIFFLTDIPNFHHFGLASWKKRKQYLHDGDEILFRWLREEAGASDRPFFLYYHYRDLHQPYAPGEAYEALFANNAFGSPWNPLSWVRRFLAHEKMAVVQSQVVLPRGTLDFAPWDKRWVDAFYDGEVRRMDDRIFARLRRVLDEEGLADNTIIVVSADHGEELLEHGVIGHVSTFKEGRLAEEVARIPLVFWAPNHLPKGLVLEEDLVQAIDVMPTLLDLVGAPIPPGVQGRSLRPLFEGGVLPPRPVFLETSGGGYTANLEQYATRTRVVRTERWKLVWHTPSNDIELYEIAVDPTEDDEVSQAYPQTADSLLQVLRTWAQENPRVRGEAAEVEATHGTTDAVLRPDGQTRVLFPSSGDTLQYIGAGQTIQLEWDGGLGRYTVEYDVGLGAYHLDGLLEVASNTPSYGPFHADFWNSLVLYNPWNFRVYPQGRPEAASEWVSFHLAASDDVGFSLSGHLLVFMGTVRQTMAELDSLARGLLLASIDLGVWLAQIPVADVTAWALLLAIAGALIWPRLQRFGDERIRAWGRVVIWVAIVYATIPVFPVIWVNLRDHTGPGIAHLGTIPVAGVAFWLSIRVCRRSWEEDALWRLAVLIPVLGAYVWLLSVFGRFPAERLHLLEYGVMAVILLEATRLHRPYAAAYAWSLGLTALIGFGDETIQWVLPQRFFEVKDAGLNVVAGALGLILTALARGRAGHR